MSLTKKVAARLFDVAAALGRPIGGLRPHRIVHRLCKLAYDQAPRPEDFRWYSDRHGLQMKLHPYYLIDREIIAFGAYELPLQRYIEKNIRPGMTCLDVGANMGAVALHLALRAGPTGKVYGFEPVPANAQRLREHATRNSFDNRLQIVECALSDTNSQLELLVAAPSHVNQGMGSLVEVDHGDLTGKITVKSLRLDDFCETHSLSSIDFIKVDIQGAEPLFLAGAERTLRTMHPKLVMEVAPSSLSSSGYTSCDLLSRMESLGYMAWLLKSSGETSNRLTAATCAPDFTAQNVLFEQRKA